MIRLSRAGRERAIKDAIKRLDKQGKHKMHTCGEICRKMGIKSNSKIKYILRDMVDRLELVIASTPIDGYEHEIDIYGLPVYVQMALPERFIIINGESVKVQ